MRVRVLVIALVLVALGGLVAWQQIRQRAVAECLADGGTWDGNGCRNPGVIIQRDIRRL